MPALSELYFNIIEHSVSMVLVFKGAQNSFLFFFFETYRTRRDFLGLELNCLNGCVTF